MKRLLFAVLAVSIAVAVSSAVTTHPASAQDIFGEDAVSAKPVEKANVKKQDDKAKLQAEYLALTKARSELMTEEELKQAITESKKTNNRLAARRELERAAKILSEIVDKHPETPEARAAMRCKNALMWREVEPGPISNKPEFEFEDFDDGAFDGNLGPPSIPSKSNPFQRSPQFKTDVFQRN